MFARTVLAGAARRLHVSGGGTFWSVLPSVRPTALVSTPSRTLFWGKSGGDGDDGKSDKDNEAAEQASEIIVGGNGSESSSALSRIGIGENAPKPPNLLAVPIQRRPLFPGFMAPLVVTDEALVEAMIALKKTPAPFVGVFLVKDGSVDLTVDKFSLTRLDQVHDTGTLAHIQQLEAGPGGAIAMLMAHRRVAIRDQVTIKTPPLIVRVSHLSQKPLESVSSDQVKALSNEILATLRDIIRLNPLFQQHVSYFARRVDVTNPYALADFAASLTTADARDLQDVLETMELEPRLGKALLLLKKEQQLASLQQSIKADVEKRIDKQQRTYFLMEQLKSIKKELGLEKDDKDALVAKFTERVAGLTMPPSAKQVFDEELEKLQVLERNSSEFNVTRTYLDWLTSVPWGKYSPDNFDLAAARAILDEDHYGMADVKERILEFIAVGKLKGSVQGKILLLVGPPGVGKTSIGKSIARSLGRSFYRFSVGGLSDVAEIKGHRRTYIGAMPGKLIQCMKSTGVSNPLVLVDEIDKLGSGRGYGGGDPASALLEMLDPSQNSSFMDHYLDTPLDASKVLFLCTANTTDTIPGPLLDRMEVIRLSGYDAPEKLQIAKRYLDPKIRLETGLTVGGQATPATVKVEESALSELIRWYAREAGVRNLEKLLGKIYRKAAISVVQARERKAAEAAAGSSSSTGAATSPHATSSLPSDSTGAAAAVEVAVMPTDASGEQTLTSSVSSSGSSAAGGDSSVAPGAAADAPAAPTPSAPAPPSSSDAASPADTPTASAPSAPTPVPAIPVEDAEWTVTADNLEKYVGKPPFTSDRLYDIPPPGVVMGLAWTQMGGSVLYIEVASPYSRMGGKYGRDVTAGSGGSGGVIVESVRAVAGRQQQCSAGSVGLRGRSSESGWGREKPWAGGSGALFDSDGEEDDAGKGKGPVTIEGGAPSGDEGGKGSAASPSRPTGGSLRLTGKLGEVMQESAQIAYTLARRWLREGMGPAQAGNDFLDTTPLHMHVPEGATPKDGPSAGITMTTALLSLAMDKPARPDLAMTGEVSLTGRVLPVGGIREKVMAARRSNVRTLVLPVGNRKDFVELPDHLKEGLTVTFATTYHDVVRVAFEYPESLLEEERARLQGSHPSHMTTAQPEDGAPGNTGPRQAGPAGRPAWMVVPK